MGVYCEVCLLRVYVGIDLICQLKFTSLLRPFGVCFVVFVLRVGLGCVFPIILVLYVVSTCCVEFVFCLSCGVWFCRIYFNDVFLGVARWYVWFYLVC